jgi:hypothetical protein
VNSLISTIKPTLYYHQTWYDVEGQVKRPSRYQKTINSRTFQNNRRFNKLQEKHCLKRMILRLLFMQTLHVLSDQLIPTSSQLNAVQSRQIPTNYIKHAVYRTILFLERLCIGDTLICLCWLYARSSLLVGIRRQLEHSNHV